MLQQMLLSKANSARGQCSAQLFPQRLTMDLKMSNSVAWEFSTLPLARVLHLDIQARCQCFPNHGAQSNIVLCYDLVRATVMSDHVVNEVYGRCLLRCRKGVRGQNGTC